MAASLHQLRTKADRLRQDQAAQLRQMVLSLDDLPEEATRAFLLTIDRQTAADRKWTFVMLSAAQNAAIVRWLSEHSLRPKIAMNLWAEMLTALRVDTGEVMLSREQLAERVNARLSSISDVLSDLEQIGAISRRRERVHGIRGPGRVVVYINPNVATHLTGGVRDEAQASHPPVKTDGCTDRTRNRPVDLSHVAAVP